jgi:branched-chain amino acid aminotransferase
VELLRKGEFKEDMYIARLSYKSTEAMGVRLHNLDNDFLVFAIPGAGISTRMLPLLYLSWRRPADNVIPPMRQNMRFIYK